MTKLVGIFGYPLAHSISPAFQQAAFDSYSMDVRYESWPVPPEELEREIGRLRTGPYIGANVTVPHKQNVIEFIDTIDPVAARIGAVNTIVRNGEGLTGYNTDATGFIRSLREKGGFEPKGCRALVLGAGGAARAAVFGLLDEGVESLAIANRTLERATSLANQASPLMKGISAMPLHGDELARVAGSADLIVNSTSIGMRHADSEGNSPLAGDHINPRSLVCDMVYNPEDTPLLQEARAAGARVLGGLPMLIYQGAAAFEIWTGKHAPVDVMFRAGESALAESS